MSSPEYESIYDIRFLMKRGIVLTLPLLKTLDAVITLKKVTADDVAKYTGRARTIESRYLSRLNKIGIVAKVKEGRRVYYIEPVEAVREAIQKYGDNMMVEQLAHQISLPADIVKLIIDLMKSGKIPPPQPAGGQQGQAT
ncbi:helix-turn-helix domain-containing protein [Desulfurococcus mucosus]|uniref:Transcriptional regulator, TrmB n=1 Tax=Desulfurococcus mucosus (strain ATCC 35584 / DSM 2162 / JCM 9187 / O7/1) TaxID=765177 RepID=E8R8H7_DESM0|nr:helix-turn-helix domain-containing protein [Desulfurococcus mucosus]ADV64803.1 transcriptional regulator, TrmB [Desulfurococcus mucosus DSM 2162]